MTSSSINSRELHACRTSRIFGMDLYGIRYDKVVCCESLGVDSLGENALWFSVERTSDKEGLFYGKGFDGNVINERLWDAIEFREDEAAAENASG